MWVSRLDVRMVFDDVDWKEVKKQSKEYAKGKWEKAKEKAKAKAKARLKKEKEYIKGKVKEERDKWSPSNPGKKWKSGAGVLKPDKKRKRKKGKKRKTKKPKNPYSKVRKRLKKNLGSNGMAYFGFPTIKPPRR